MSAKCGSCRQDIQWVRTADTDRPIPLDPGVAADGRVWIRPAADRAGPVVSGDQECPTPWKTPHRSKHAAEQERSRARRRRGGFTTVYQCRCGCWHITGVR